MLRGAGPLSTSSDLRRRRYDNFFDNVSACSDGITTYNITTILLRLSLPPVEQREHYN